MKSIIIAIGAIAIILLGAFLVTRDTPAPVQEAQSENTPAYPTITVESGTVTLTKDAETRSVVDGETLIPPFSLKSDAEGRATLNFPDGSELRIDYESTLRVDDATYRTETKDLAVSVFLSVGRVWSNIVALVTPASSWEVETSNVVATVRGTAFGVVAEGAGTTTVIGSEHTVGLTMKDPSGDMRPEYGGTLTSDTYVVITDGMVEEMMEEIDAGKTPSETFMVNQEKTDAMRNDPWVRGNEERDGTRSTEENVSSDNLDVNVVERITPTPSTVLPQPVVAARPTTLTVTSASPLTAIVGGGPSIRLTATLNYSDGSTKDVSADATWQVLGSIGVMQGNVFTPRLDASVSELGRASGSITATWKDASSGTEIFGATPIFEVKAEVISIIPEG